MMISFVIPCYNTAHCLEELTNRIKSEIIVLSIDYEIIFIDDNSPQRDYLRVEELATYDKNVKLIKFVRNFGQQKAISAGLRYAKGDWIVIMDADLEDDPKYIPQLVRSAKEGYDIVRARRVGRTHSFVKRLYSYVFHTLFDFMTGIKTDSAIGNYGIYSRKVIQVFNSMDERFRTFGLLVTWLGFRSTAIDVEHGKRLEGKSSYNFGKGLELALDAMIAFSHKPLRITVIMGFVVTLLAVIFGVFHLFRWLFVGVPVVGWTSLILSVWFTGGFIIMALGVLGIYIGKIFDETKKRPHYVIDHTTNIEPD